MFLDLYCAKWARGLGLLKAADIVYLYYILDVSAFVDYLLGPSDLGFSIIAEIEGIGA